MRLKPVPAFFALALLLLPAAAGAFRLEEAWQKSFPVGPNPRLELENVDGNIRIELGTASSIEVTAEIRIKAPSKSKARSLYKGIEFATEGDAERVCVKTHLPRVRQDAFPGIEFGEHAAIRIRYYVKVPRGTSLVVSTVNGDIELSLPADDLAKAAAHAEHGRVSRIPVSR